MAYSSEEYKYLLLRRLQRDLSMPNPSDRIYTVNFMVKLFEDLIVTESVYNEFCDLMDEELEYCWTRGIYNCTNIPSKDISAHEVLLIKPFKTLGVDVKIERPYMNEAVITFTKANGKVMTYEMLSDMDGYGYGLRNGFYVNSRSGTEYTYAKKAAPVQNLETITPIPLEDLPHNMAGPNCTWSFDATTATCTISGSGPFYGVHYEEQLGGGVYNTLIIGPNIDRLVATCLGYNMYTPNDMANLVCLRPSYQYLEIDYEALQGRRSDRPLAIYTDNPQLLNYRGPDTDFEVTYHSLSEWQG